MRCACNGTDNCVVPAARSAGLSGRQTKKPAGDGIGTFACKADAVQHETVALDAFLNILKAQPALPGGPESIGFATSASAISTDAANQVNTEQSTLAPTAQEALMPP